MWTLTSCLRSMPPYGRAFNHAPVEAASEAGRRAPYRDACLSVDGILDLKVSDATSSRTLAGL